jgi:hypothetical protein
MTSRWRAHFVFFDFGTQKFEAPMAHACSLDASTELRKMVATILESRGGTTEIDLCCNLVARVYMLIRSN